MLAYDVVNYPGIGAYHQVRKNKTKQKCQENKKKPLKPNTPTLQNHQLPQTPPQNPKLIL